MKSFTLSYREFAWMIERGIVILKEREKYANEERNLAILSFFVFSLISIPEGALIYAIVVNPSSVAAWTFFLLITILNIWLFVMGWSSYMMYKYPEDMFWRYFIKGDLEMVLARTYENGGKEYMLYGFMTKNWIAKHPIFVTLEMPNEIHTKAMGLMEGGDYEIAVDKDGQEKVVVNGGDVVDVDNDTLLVMKLIRMLYELYGDDIKRMGEEKISGEEVLQGAFE